MGGRAASGRPLKVKMISPAKTAADSVYWRSIKPKSTDHPLQADLTCPGRFRSTSWAADDHLIWPEALS